MTKGRTTTFEECVQAVMDCRRCQKPVAELTDTEHLALELNRLEKENERLLIENDFLKKLEEVTLSQIRLQDKYEAIQSSVEQFDYRSSSYVIWRVSRALPTKNGCVV